MDHNGELPSHYVRELLPYNESLLLEKCYPNPAFSNCECFFPKLVAVLKLLAQNFCCYRFFSVITMDNEYKHKGIIISTRFWLHSLVCYAFSIVPDFIPNSSSDYSQVSLIYIAELAQCVPSSLVTSCFADLHLIEQDKFLRYLSPISNALNYILMGLFVLVFIYITFIKVEFQYRYIHVFDYIDYIYAAITYIFIFVGISVIIFSPFFKQYYSKKSTEKMKIIFFMTVFVFLFVVSYVFTSDIMEACLNIWLFMNKIRRRRAYFGIKSLISFIRNDIPIFLLCFALDVISEPEYEGSDHLVDDPILIEQLDKIS